MDCSISICVIEEILSNQHKLGLILCDHVLPGENGVDLLIDLQKNEKLGTSRKVLVTGQAGLEDTIMAVNQADLNHYIAKPWTKANLDQVVRNELTEFVIQEKINPLPFMTILNSEKLSEYMRDHPLTDH